MNTDIDYKYIKNIYRLHELGLCILRYQIETKQKGPTKYVKPFHKNRYKIKNIRILNPANNIFVAFADTSSKKKAP